MAAHWGVDSLNPASSVLGIKGRPTLFDYVCDQAGRVPAFWGRYITALTFTKNGNKIKFPKLEKAEIEFIFNKSKGTTRILPIYNLAWPGVTSLRGGAPQGENDARRAIGAASSLGIPGGVFLWCDIEPGWKTASAWYSGWWKVMLNSQYGGRGGIYENPLKWNAANFGDPYRTALKGAFGFVVQDPHSTARYLWSQQPCKTNIAAKPIPTHFKPAELEGVPNATVIWQYAINCLHAGGGNGQVDFNMASDIGLSTMWKGSGSGGGGGGGGGLVANNDTERRGEREPLVIAEA